MHKSTINDAVLLVISVVIIGSCYGSFHVFGLGYEFNIDVSMCHGKYSTPINEEIYEIVEKDFPIIKMSGFDKPADSTELFNNKYAVVLNMTYDIPPTIEGGPLSSIYKFADIHFHWHGNDDMNNDFNEEHAPNSVELHLVFYNEMFLSVSEASKYDDGIAVMSFIYEIKTKDNPDYNKFIDLLPRVSEPRRRVSLEHPLKLWDLMTPYTFYFTTYKGSLTMPPCSRNVIWLDFEEPIPISLIQKYIQLEVFFKQLSIQQSPELNSTIYLQTAFDDSPEGPGHSIPFTYSNNRANNHYLIITDIWTILNTFAVLKFCSY